VLELTERVQQAVEVGDWQRATALEIERRAALERLFVERTVVSPELRAALLALGVRHPRLAARREPDSAALPAQSAALGRGGPAAASYDAAAGPAER